MEKEKIEGKIIKKYSPTSIELEDGTILSWSTEGGQGADDGWCQWMVHRINGIEVFRD